MPQNTGDHSKYARIRRRTKRCHSGRFVLCNVIKHKDLFRYIISSEINNKKKHLKNLMRPVCHPYGHVFDIFEVPAKSNDIANIFESLFLYRKFHDMIVLCPLNILK